MKIKHSADCRITRVAPYFLVDDVFATAEFYRDVLGFTFDGFFGDPPSFNIVKARRRPRHVPASAAREGSGRPA